MSGSTNRRGFIASCVSAGALSVTANVRSAAAIEPIKRTGHSKIKLSLAAYSYRDLLTGKNPKVTLADFIDDCAAMELEGTELTSYYFPPDASPEFLRQLKAQAFRLGLDVSGTAVGNNFCYPPGEKRDQEMQLVRRWVDNAEILSAPVIRIFSGQQQSGQSAAEAHRLAVEAMEQACAYAGDHGVFLALENHGGLTADAEGLLSLVRDVKSPWFGVNLDTGNFHSDDVYGDLAKLAPYAVNVQVKVVVSGPDGKKRPSDFQRLAKILNDAGYRGYVALEFEEKGDPREECPKYIKQLREAFAV
jgi:sugar phosphate isomerase/epimerase